MKLTRFLLTVAIFNKKPHVLCKKLFSHFVILSVTFCNKVSLNHIWKKHYWLSTLDLLESSIMFVLCSMSHGPSYLDGRCTSVTLPRRKLQNSLEFTLGMWSLLKSSLRKLLTHLSLKSKLFWFDSISSFGWCLMVTHEVEI